MLRATVGSYGGVISYERGTPVEKGLGAVPTTLKRPPCMSCAQFTLRVPYAVKPVHYVTPRRLVATNCTAMQLAVQVYNQ